jgi:hypothetical protein
MILLCSAIGGLTSSCVSIKPGYVADDKLAATKAVEQFHARLNAHQFDEIYHDANEFFRRPQTKEELIGGLQKTVSRFGQFKKVISSDMRVIVTSPIQIRAVYSSSFAKGNATELFTFVKSNDAVQLVQYQIYPGLVRQSTP